MREEWLPVEAGSPMLRQWSETEAEALLTPVEAALLQVTLAGEIGRDANVERQIATARVSCREFTDYGFYVTFADLGAEPAAMPGVLGRGTGHATIGLKGQTRLPLMTMTFSKHGRLEFLEGVPSDGVPWSVEECAALLRAPVADVEIWGRGNV